ncbi:molybdopterin-guanine dinucleotide biosynthesis protein B [Paenibacillus sp. 19GGS1-52]|uniref:molybdopterin-guanine dinucleotide biosynthesis protein B n=1 Tax=Paenibacillus sp. 19GGS1-52 TaxID=2758563 RepID=UPI001EFBA81A|nr:molybdopterin-guanine dinucleotide biosynthesis protein B [Paenibacillus sp. 19GGS1-52]ULO10064.1 molybdopterin-guanine dinucleotide biosynthesis protein B [Paenibacillus sp. 19GGS1-52]
MNRSKNNPVRSRSGHRRRYQRSRHQVSQPAVTSQPAVLQIVGYKNRGKTTLICALIPLLQEKGYTVAVIKHDAHSFEIDHEGTDTFRQRAAGASAVAITGGERTVRIEEYGSSLAELIASFASYDFILVEGFKNVAYPKIVLIQQEDDLELLKELNNVWATAVWAPMNNAITFLPPTGFIQYDINDVPTIAGDMCQQRYYFQNFII